MRRSADSTAPSAVQYDAAVRQAPWRAWNRRHPDAFLRNLAPRSLRRRRPSPSLVTAADAVTLRWAGRGDMQTTDPHSQNERPHQQHQRPGLRIPGRARQAAGASCPRSRSRGSRSTRRRGASSCARASSSTTARRSPPTTSCSASSARAPTRRSFASMRTRAGDPEEDRRPHRRVHDQRAEPDRARAHRHDQHHVARRGARRTAPRSRRTSRAKEDMITAREANGTGPYSLVSRAARREDRARRRTRTGGASRPGCFDGNVDEIVYTPIVSDAHARRRAHLRRTRLRQRPAAAGRAAARQTPNIKVLEGVENRIVFIGMDQARDELLYSNVKGKNPFKDKRVRQALYQADRHRRDQQEHDARPVEADRRDPAQSPQDVDARDREAAARSTRRRRRSCSPRPAIRTASRSRSTARTTATSTTRRSARRWPAMWSQIGVTIKVNAMPRAVYFPKLEKTDTSMYMLGWGGASTDAIFTLQPVLSTLQRQGRRRLQLRPLHEPEARRADREDQGRHEPEARLGMINEALLRRTRRST